MMVFLFFGAARAPGELVGLGLYDFYELYFICAR